jgi:cobalamin biosynthesis Mg chelatase CobN
MDKADSAVARQVAQAAAAFHQGRTGHAPESVAVVPSGTVVQAFTPGSMLQVFLLAGGVPADTWSGNGSVDQS